MSLQSKMLDLGKRLKCGEVFIWNYDSFTCAIECTLCEDRPSCSLQDYFEHIQLWHQEDWQDDTTNEAEKSEFELRKDNGEVDCECEMGIEAEISKPPAVNTQPFEEVLIQIDESDKNEFEFSDEAEHFSDNDCSSVCVDHEESYHKYNEKASAVTLPGYTEKNAGISIDDLAFQDLNIQCAEIDTTNSTFENDFRQWCRKQHRSREIEWSRACSEDSGVYKSESSSVATSPALSISDDSDHFRIDETNIKEQIQFGLNQPLPKPKLTTADMEELIELYKQHPRLWQSSHDEHNNAEKCRESWQEIKQKWNEICRLNLNEIDIRIRLSTLRQRYLKERKRREMDQEHENPNSPHETIPKRFRYYEKLKFLDEQKFTPYASQGERITHEYQKLIESYAQFPILWDKYDAKHKNAELRQQAYDAICKALHLSGINLTVDTIRVRLSTLKQRYRMAKVQRLQCQLKGRTFIPDFKHYENMKFLDRHIAPYVCDVCGKICRLFNEYESHLEKAQHNVMEISTIAVEEASKETARENEPTLAKCDENYEETNETQIKMPVQIEQQVDQEIPKTLAKNTSEAVEEIVDKIPQAACNEYETVARYETKVDEVPQANEIIAYVTEQNAVAPVQWTNESFNDLPIYIMETTLPDEFQQNVATITEANIMQPVEMQHLILMNNEDELLNGSQVVFLDSQSIVLKPMKPDEIYAPCNEVKLRKNAENANYANENINKKVYTNLVNVFGEPTEAFSSSSESFENVPYNEHDFENLGLTNEQEITSEELNVGWDCSSTVVQPKAFNQRPTEENKFLDDFSDVAAETEISASSDVQQTVFTPEFPQTTSEAFEKPNLEAMTDQTQADISSSIPCLDMSNTMPAISTTADRYNTDILVEHEIQKSPDEMPDSTSNTKVPLEITEVRVLKSVDASKSITKNSFQELPAENVSMHTRSSKALKANVTCDDAQFDMDLETNEVNGTTRKRMPYTLTRLTEPQGHKLIELYRLNPQLWNPEHTNYDSRRHKRLSWRLLATQFNASFYLNYNWLQVQRKMMDYVKYYRREQRRIKAKPNVPKWPFFEKLKFLDQVNANTTGLQKRMQQRQETLQIIEVYKAHPQLWDTEHGQYTKRNQRQCTIALMCSRLQEVHNMTIGPAKLKQCLLDLRYNYRTTKLARIEAEKRNEAFEPHSRFEFYDALQFLEPHLPPFNCEKCKIEFKCFSDFSTHCKKEHKQQPRNQCPLLANDIDKNTLDNVCHICGIKFTLRQNLIQHLNRHYCGRSLPCPTCDKKFFTKTALEEHQRTHTRVPAVICPECGRTFFNKSKLTQHLKRHRNQRDYPCDQCDKAFYSAFERERHVRRHLNIRDKICPVCGKSFVAGSGYYTHIKLHNKTKQYSCTACKKEFSQYAGLYKHRRKYHP